MRERLIELFAFYQRHKTRHTEVPAVEGSSESARENVIFTGVQLSKDDTPGCTKEACNFRDANHIMQKRGIVVLGVSNDDVASHQKFADKYQLPFPLLADTEATVSQLYDVYSERSFVDRA